MLLRSAILITAGMVLVCAITWRSLSSGGSGEGQPTAVESLANAVMDIDDASQASIRTLPEAVIRGFHANKSLSPADAYLLGLARVFGHGVERDTAAGLGLITESAQRGWSPAQCTLARVHIRGVGCDRSPEAAAMWLTEASEHELPAAQTDLGVLYYHGIGVPKDVDRAVNLLLLASERDASVRSLLFRFAAVADVAMPWLGEKRSWLEAAVATGDKNAAYLLAIDLSSMAETETELARASSLFHIAATAGIAGAQFEVGSSLVDKGGPAEVEKGLILIRAASDQSWALAELFMGSWYHFGSGKSEADAKSRAEEWYRRAALHGSQIAYIRLGQLYESEGMFELASQVYRVAAVQRNPDAQFVISLLLEERPELQIVEAEAGGWLFNAANAGQGDAELLLGRRIASGQGYACDFDEANRLFRSADAHGVADAAFEIGQSFAMGRGVTVSSVEAVRWYKRATVRGSSDGATELAIALANGHGIPSDRAAGMSMLEALEKQGSDRARQAVEGLLHK